MHIHRRGSDGHHISFSATRSSVECILLTGHVLDYFGFLPRRKAQPRHPRTSTSASELTLVIIHIATGALICRNDVFTIFASQTLGSYVTCSNFWPIELRLRPVCTVCIQSWHYVLGRFLRCLLFPRWLRLRFHCLVVHSVLRFPS